MNLLIDPWLPVRRARNNTREFIAPWALTDQLDSNPVVALDLPRADFNTGLIQFLVALAQTAWAPEDDKHWSAAYEQPPSPEALRDACQPLLDAFEFDGDGPRFMQDRDLDEQEDPRPIARLLIEEPGGQTLRDNKDHFTKRGQRDGLGLAAAIGALYTLQINAPSGGKGHRTSLRGGGPLTTLVVPDPLREPMPVNLWRLVWLNVLPKAEFESLPNGDPALTAPDAIFPWLAATRTSDPNAGGVETTALDVHPLQLYWSMPRRIRLKLDGLSEGDCTLTAKPGPLVSHYSTRPYGVNYSGPWAHPLSPYVRNKQGEWLPIHPQQAGIGYRHWLGLTLGGGDDDLVNPAAVVREHQQARRRAKRQVRLWAFGYDMDNMKARGWHDALMPLYHIDADYQRPFAAAVKALIEVAERIASNLREALKKAWFKPGATVRGDFAFLLDAYWQETEGDFYRLLDALHAQLEQLDDPDQLAPLRSAWLDTLDRAALRLFDQHALNGDIAHEDPKRLVTARLHLKRFNRTKEIHALLQLPDPTPTARRQRA